MFVCLYLSTTLTSTPPPPLSRGSAGREVVQPSCLPVRVAGQAAPPAVAEPEPFPLLVEPDTLQFAADQPRVAKLKINNKTRLDYEVTYFVVDVRGL